MIRKILLSPLNYPSFNETGGLNVAHKPELMPPHLNLTKSTLPNSTLMTYKSLKLAKKNSNAAKNRRNR